MAAAQRSEAGSGPPGLRESVAVYLSRTLGLPPDDVQDLVDVGAANVQACLDGARRAASLQEAAGHAHALKGNLVNMGLSELAVRAKELERAAASGSSELSADLLSQLESDLGGL
jgi:hypothetical protein